MEDPSTIRRAVADIGGAPYGEDSLAGQTGDEDPDSASMGTLYHVCSLFAICSFRESGAGLSASTERVVLACFRAQWPNLNRPKGRPKSSTLSADRFSGNVTTTSLSASAK